MRYPQGGGPSAERRAFHERSRMQAAELFTWGHGKAAVAKQSRVSVRSVQRWRQFIDTHDWITYCSFLAAYARDLNPAEGNWLLLRRSGCPAETGLTSDITPACWEVRRPWSNRDARSSGS